MILPAGGDRWEQLAVDAGFGHVSAAGPAWQKGLSSGFWHGFGHGSLLHCRGRVRSRPLSAARPEPFRGQRQRTRY